MLRNDIINGRFYSVLNFWISEGEFTRKLDRSIWDFQAEIQFALFILELIFQIEVTFLFEIQKNLTLLIYELIYGLRINLGIKLASNEKNSIKVHENIKHQNKSNKNKNKTTKSSIVTIGRRTEIPFWQFHPNFTNHTGWIYV